MCVVSMVGDHYSEKWKRDMGSPGLGLVSPLIPNVSLIPNGSFVYRFEFDLLKKEVEEMKLLLKRAKAYDEANNEPDCEMDEKVEFLKKMAEYVGVNLDEIFK